MDKLDNGRSGRPDPSVVVFLSLYLLLLAFFILLNSLSQMEQDRTRAALGSIDATFKSRIETALAWRPARSVPGSVSGTERLPARLKRPFEPVLPIGRFEVLQVGNLIRVTVPSDLIFVPGRSALRATRTRLMESIADGLSQRTAEGHYQVALQIGTKADLGSAGEPELALARAGVFARDLRRRGVPARQIAIGLGPGDPDQLRLTFDIQGDDAVDFRQVVRW